jgi:hypothetical protein
MSLNTVVVTGVKTSPLGELPFQTPQDTTLERMFSGKDYGNFLPELWAFMRGKALHPQLAVTSPLATALKEKAWAVVTDTVDGRLKSAKVWPLVETSGSIFRGRCLRCHQVMDVTREDYQSLPLGGVPSCLHCGKNRVRPDVVLVGEKMHHRRLVDDFMVEADLVVFVSVNEEAPDIQHWASLAKRSLIVNKGDGVLSGRRLDLTTNEWLAAGCPNTQ